MPAVSLTLALGQRNSTYVLAVITGAFVGEKVMNGGMDAMWRGANSGVTHTLATRVAERSCSSNAEPCRNGVTPARTLSPNNAELPAC